MYKNKRGMSAIITTLIIIALALVAIGIIWFVIQNVLSSTKSEVTQGTEDLFGTCVGNYPGSDEMINGTHINDSVICNTSIKIVGGEYCCIA